jgi:hypothetical protein
MDLFVSCFIGALFVMSVIQVAKQWITLEGKVWALIAIPLYIVIGIVNSFDLPYALLIELIFAIGQLGYDVLIKPVLTMIENMGTGLTEAVKKSVKKRK